MNCFLTKALGTGIISTALKFERAPAEAIAAAIRSMITLNRVAAEALQSLPAGVVHACTDVTGFGLIGHASEMAAASRCTLEIEGSAVPLLPGVLALVQGNVPGGGRTNAQHFGGDARVSSDIHAELVQLFYDPQTSGGLLVAVDPRACRPGGQRPPRGRRAGGPGWPGTPADGGQGHGQVAPRSLAVQPC